MCLEPYSPAYLVALPNFIAPDCLQAALAVMNPLSLTFGKQFMTNHFACSGWFKPVDTPETNDSSFSPKQGHEI